LVVWVADEWESDGRIRQTDGCQRRIRQICDATHRRTACYRQTDLTNETDRRNCQTDVYGATSAIYAIDGCVTRLVVVATALGVLLCWNPLST